MMKNIFRMMGLCALIMLAAVSCKKNEESAVMTFRATMTSPTYDAKTYLDSNLDLRWNSGDAIMLYAMDDSQTMIDTAVFTTNDEGVKVASFSGNIAQAETYFAFYPASMASGDGNMKASSTQQFVPNGIPTDTYVMACSINDGSMDFQFRGLFGLLAIPMKGNATIGSIEFIDAFFKNRLSGEFTLNFEAIGQNDWNNFMEESDSHNRSNSVILDCGPEGYTLSEVPVRAYFALRPMACSQGFTVVVKDLNGETLWTKDVPQNSSNMIQPERILLMPEITVNAEP